MHVPHFQIGFATIALGASLASAQNAHVPSGGPSQATLDYAAVQRGFEAWRGEHGSTWSLEFDFETRAGVLLHGAPIPPPFAPTSDADFSTLARLAVAQAREILRVDPATLGEAEVVFLPLANAGTTDKVTVELRQAVGGVPVLGASVNLLFDARGGLLGIDSSALPEVERTPISPAITAERAARIALDLFRADAGIEPTSADEPILAIEGALAGKYRVPRLVWRVAVRFDADDAAPAGFEYRIDAANGNLSSRIATVHHDVSGSVRTLATPGVLPDTASNPETLQTVVRAEVSSPSGIVETDATGAFTVPGASAPLQVTVRYRGSFAKSKNAAGPEYTLTTTLNSASGNTVTMNPTGDAAITAEANAFVWINALRDWVRAVVPTDSHADFQAVANVNLAQTCNAYYNGGSVNFFLAGGGCVNTSYSTVVAHEMGHWLNDRYASGNGGDGFGEGNADTWATYLADDPEVGENFCGAGCTIRSGNNTRQYCGNGNSACYGEVHADGEVLMGALWKVRARLKTALGASAGSAAADTLFLSWMNAYNDSQIKPVVETHWLVLDDDDGVIANGTPHHDQIDGGFRDQGFPGHTISFVNFSHVVKPVDTPNELHPSTVSADLVAGQFPPVASATLWYRLDLGAYVGVPMAPTTGSTWSGSIPAQSCPTRVDYYISATDSAGNSDYWPATAPAEPRTFHVEERSFLFSEDFEGSLAGWTHGQTAGQDDWQASSQFGVDGSFGLAGDPTSAVSGTSVYGNDLGAGGSDGLYPPGTTNYLRSPAIDCSGSVGTRLRLERWLRVERGQYDQATIAVDGNVVWSNPVGSDLLDDAWTELDLDISAFADLDPSVVLEFRLASDAGLEFGGWNVDDVQVYVHGSCDDYCAPPLAYCTSKTTSLGELPSIGSTGTNSFAAADFQVTLASAPPNKQAVCFYGAAPGAAAFNGGYLCVQQPVQRMPATQTSSNGDAAIAVPIDAGMVGTQARFQWWFRDPLDPYFVGLSDALLVHFCD